MASTFKHAPAFDFYPERWTHGTRHMTKVERCDYIDLLCVQWTEDGIPDDFEVVARILNYKRPDQIPKTVLNKFPKAEEGKRRNKRLETERVKQRERYEKKSLGASKTNAKRWQNGSLSDQLAIKNDVASESPPPTSDLPISNEIERSSLPKGCGRQKPMGYPRTEKEARQMARDGGANEEVAATYWQHFDGCGYYPQGNFVSAMKAREGFQDLNDVRNGKPKPKKPNEEGWTHTQ